MIRVFSSAGRISRSLGACAHPGSFKNVRFASTSSSSRAAETPQPKPKPYAEATPEDKRVIMSFVPAVTTVGSILVTVGVVAIGATYLFGSPFHKPDAHRDERQ
eukprot:TRINITY_DN12508_c0_g1_i1.p2 TRINITY_DN12508_c0_g1~~TRINITY_DN12508_c0_g1_i1.p2  ORF type:complete len:104 (+),score=22.99 TRINITY_DN12508_c0_g1_i1:70-381(+)